MLSFAYRFHGHGSLRYVYKNGDAVRTHNLTIKHILNKNRERPRFAVVISKKVLKSAVGRNRIRRRIYEIIRLEIPNFKSNHDVVVLVFSSEVRTVPQEDLVNQLKDLFLQAGLYR